MHQFLRKSFPFDLFVAWNPNDPVFGVWYNYFRAMGIPVVPLERALIPNFLELGLKFTTPTQEYPDEFFELGRTTLRNAPSSHIHKQRQANAPNEIDILVLGSWAEVMNASSLLAPYTCQIAEQLAQSLPNHVVVYKPHPLSPKHYQRLCTKANVSHADPLALSRKASIVVTSASKLEREVVQEGRPLILLGGGFLNSLATIPTVYSIEDCINRCLDTNWYNKDETYSEFTRFIGYQVSHHWYDLRGHYQGSRKFLEFVEHLEKVETSKKMYTETFQSMDRIRAIKLHHLPSSTLIRELLSRLFRL